MKSDKTSELHAGAITLSCRKLFDANTGAQWQCALHFQRLVCPVLKSNFLVVFHHK